MKEVLINNIMINISKDNKYSNVKLAEIKYGLESLYLTITKFLVIFTINIVLGTCIELLYFLIAFGLLKFSGFGLHTKKSWQCWLTSIPIFSIFPYLIKNISLNDGTIYILLSLSFVLLIMYAPSDTEKRPLINKKKRLMYKIITIMTSLVYISIIIFVNNSYLNSILIYALFLEALIINPLSYKLFGLKYNNYLNYKKGGLK